MKLQLNFNKPENYGFFCPVSRLSLSRSNPVGEVNEVTPAIRRGLRTKALLDVTETDAEQKSETEPKKPEEPSVEIPSVQEPQESVPSEKSMEQEVIDTPSQMNVETSEIVSEEPVAPVKEPKKRGRKAK